MKMNIAIDGPSAAGKSTIAKILAKRLHYAHLDTGAMYRCVAYAAKCKNVDATDEAALVAMIDDLDIHFDDEGAIYLGLDNVAKEIRTNEMSMAASAVSAFPKVRACLVKKQQAIAKAQGYILDGRDIGTVVLPDAQVKVFMVASVEARAQRRFKEYLEKGIEANYDEIYQDIEKRDYQDTHRAASPLKKASDAIEIDTSNMSIEEVVNAILELIHKIEE